RMRVGTAHGVSPQRSSISPRAFPEGVTSGRRFKPAELGTDGVRVGMVEIVQDGRGILPGVPGAVRVSGGVPGVAEVGERGGFLVAVAEIPVQVDGAPETGGRLVVVAEVRVGVAQAGPRDGLAVVVAERLMQREGLPE